MSFRLYIARLKCLVRNKENMFWSYAFPLVLATCFFFAFNNLWTVDSFETIKIAYVKENTQLDPLRLAMDEAMMSEDTAMFEVMDSDRDQASKFLEDGKIEAYIVNSTEPELFVKNNGINETIIKSFLDNYRRIAATVQTIMSENPNAIKEGLMDDVMQSEAYVEEIADDRKPDATLIYFYALFAFSCIFAANLGLEEVINIQANQSMRGARINVSPIRKMKLFLCNMAAAFTIHMGSILLLFVYMYYGLKINFGDNLAYIFITILVGSIAGLTLGATISVYVRKKPSVQSAILTSVVMTAGFLSGMMFADMKYIIATKAPLLGYINPVTLVSDTLYSLYFYDTYDRFYFNITLLCIIILVLGVASYFGLRRKTYECI